MSRADVESAADYVAKGLNRHQDALNLIVEDKDVQGGAATFRGTRLLVHHIAELLAQGIDETELREDYPRLTPEMIAAAPIYAREHPQNGRPLSPAWRTVCSGKTDGR